jgi:hypothetical protein
MSGTSLISAGRQNRQNSSRTDEQRPKKSIAIWKTVPEDPFQSGCKNNCGVDEGADDSRLGSGIASSE